MSSSEKRNREKYSYYSAHLDTYITEDCSCAAGVDGLFFLFFHSYICVHLLNGDCVHKHRARLKLTVDQIKIQCAGIACSPDVCTHACRCR